MKEFLSEHWILLFALFIYAMGFLNGYFNGKRKQMTNEQAEYLLVRGSGNKMKRCEFFIIYNADYGKTAFKVKGYMFEKFGHWFTVRRRNPKVPNDERYAKWIISDFVTGMIMTSTDSRLENVRYALPECRIVQLLGFYDNCAICGGRTIKETLQSDADMIHAAMVKDNPKSKMLDLHTSQAGDLYN